MDNPELDTRPFFLQLEIRIKASLPNPPIGMTVTPEVYKQLEKGRFLTETRNTVPRLWSIPVHVKHDQTTWVIVWQDEGILQEYLRRPHDD